MKIYLQHILQMSFIIKRVLYKSRNKNTKLNFKVHDVHENSKNKYKL